MFKKIIILSIMFLAFSSVSIQAEEKNDKNMKFSCKFNILDNMQNVYYSDTWNIKDSEPDDEFYHDLIYKNSTNSRKYNLYQKSHIFYREDTPDYLYIKSEIKYDYKSSLSKIKERKEFNFKDKVYLGQMKNYSNGTNNLSLICNRK